MVDVNKLAARRVLSGSPPAWMSRRETRWGWGVCRRSCFGEVRAVKKARSPCVWANFAGTSPSHRREIGVTPALHCSPLSAADKEPAGRFYTVSISIFIRVRRCAWYGPCITPGRTLIDTLSRKSLPAHHTVHGSRCAAAAVLDRSPARRWEMGDIFKRKTLKRSSTIRRRAQRGKRGTGSLEFIFRPLP